MLQSIKLQITSLRDGLLQTTRCLITRRIHLLPPPIFFRLLPPPIFPERSLFQQEFLWSFVSSSFEQLNAKNFHHNPINPINRIFFLPLVVACTSSFPTTISAAGVSGSFDTSCITSASTSTCAYVSIARSGSASTSISLLRRSASTSINLLYCQQYFSITLLTTIIII